MICLTRREKKKTVFIQMSIGILSLILAGMIVVMMHIVSSIQGTARVINYAGLVRGKTQRIVKLEMAGQPEDAMIQDIESYINGLRNGSSSLNLVKLNDADFQNKMQELDEYFSVLSKELLLVRENGFENTEIIPRSEKFFMICDEATNLAEIYAQSNATSLSVLEKWITADIVLLMLFIGCGFVKAVHYASANRILQQKAYLDSATGLPNKNKCEELLNVLEPASIDTGICSFDLNNLHNVNNRMGHEAGDEYIHRFAVCLRGSIPAEQFVGRFGGDEFLAVTHGMSREQIDRCLENMRRKVAQESESHPDIPLSYAVGYALASDFQNLNLKELYHYADHNMYINKNHVKLEEKAKKERINKQVLHMLEKRRISYSNCLYCSANTDTYRIIEPVKKFFLPEEGSYSIAVNEMAKTLLPTEKYSDMIEQIRLSELCRTIRTDDDIREFTYRTSKQQKTYHLMLIPVDWNTDATLHHFLMVFETLELSW